MAGTRERRVAAALAAEIRALAGRQNLKAFNLHKMSGIPRSTMAAIWNGEAVIDVDQLARISVALGVDPGTLLSTAIAATTLSPDQEAILHSNELTEQEKADIRAQINPTRMADNKSAESGVNSSVRESRSGSRQAN